MMHKAKVLALTVVSMVATSGFSQAEYTYDDLTSNKRTLIVTITPKDAEEILNIEKLVPEGAVVTNLIKKGAGTIVVPRALDTSSYAFDLVVEEGIYKFFGRTGVGDTSQGVIVVHEGATLWNLATADDCSIGMKTTYVAGSGVGGIGACYTDSYQYKPPFGKIVLTSDATIGLQSSINQIDDVELSGHQLKILCNGLLSAKWSTFTAPGEVNLVGTGADAYLSMSEWMKFTGGSDGVLSVSNSAIRISNCYPITSDGYNWRLNMFAGASILLLRGFSNESSEINKWNGLISLNSIPIQVRVSESAENDVSLNLAGRVSGSGLLLEGRETAPLTLYLSSSENDFTNGVSGINARIHLMHNGALPTKGGDLVLTNSNVYLEDACAYRLPRIILSGSATLTGGENGSRAESVTKHGDGILAYDSMVSADKMNVEGGILDISSASNLYRKALSGLVYGEKIFTDQPEDASMRYAAYGRYIWNANPTGELGTNGIVKGLNRLYTGWEEGFDSNKVNRVYSYQGYIWNNSPTNELWAFAGDSGNAFRLTIDGTNVLALANWYGSPKLQIGWAEGTSSADVGTNTVWLAPGPHRFVYVIALGPGTDNTSSLQYYGSYYVNNYGSFKKSGIGADYEEWADNIPLLYNKNGICTRTHTDYLKMIDPGDGSLFTYDIPSATGVLNPITGETVKYRPEFDSMRFAPGTSVKLGGYLLAIGNLDGWPTTQNGDVVVTGTWTINPSEVGLAPFAIDGKLTLAEGHRIVFTDDAKPARCYRDVDILIGVAGDGIEGNPTIDSDGHWKIFVDDNQLKARYIGDGFRLIVY